ncbi:DUF3883 domain-containing protein [Heyndrickxia oleronia]|uniref:DUF3883 domain-containing protein n=1 Tax=Heyndrickxia oleronia TaxID=38875 RepID=UPI00203A6E2D|nr:DUF3883 domain-containing protein [Heyndrickxia oleronia]MCM3454764.1 DUF3883 domain-containing protein [Heyndrickxia oleronia]
MKVYLSKRERSKLILSLSNKKRKALFSAISITHKSEFANLLASYKGTEKWEFIQYIDHGKLSKFAKCECGRSLRYEFVLKHKESNEIRSLGITHLQEELNIPDEIAKEIYKKIHNINYDLDEILVKEKQGWLLDKFIALYIENSKFKIPLEIDILLKANLPILERHVNRLFKEMKSATIQPIHDENTVSPLPDELKEIASKIYGNIIPLVNTQIDASYLITKDALPFEVLGEINFHRFNNQHRYRTNLFNVVWSYDSSKTKTVYIKSHGPKMCIAKIDSLPNSFTGILAIFGYKPIAKLQEEVRKFLDKNKLHVDINTIHSKTNEFDSYIQLKQGYMSQIDFLKLHEYKIEIGKLGEAFVYDYERQKLNDTSFCGRIDKTKALNPTNGYDILSFEEDGTPIYIEVKASVNLGEDFFISSHELDVYRHMKKNGKKYVIYRVENILAENPEDIALTKIYDLEQNKRIKMEPYNWKVNFH